MFWSGIRSRVVLVGNGKDFVGNRPSRSCFDNILISGTTRGEHIIRLRGVLTRLRDCGLTAKREKCVFGMKSFRFLDYIIVKEGVHAAEDKTNAIVNAPSPLDVTQLRAFLGMINYYSRFIRNCQSSVPSLA